MNALQKVILFIGMSVGLLGLVSCDFVDSDTVPEDTISSDEDTVSGDEDTVSGDEGIEVLLPVTASEVTDPASLKAFALDAKVLLETDYEVAIEDFETEKWQNCYSHYFFFTQCSTYLYVLNMDLNVVFKPDVTSLEGFYIVATQNIELKYLADIKNVAQAGGGFVQHSWNEDATSYAVLFENEGESYILVAVYVQQEQDTEQSAEISAEQSAEISAEVP